MALKRPILGHCCYTMQHWVEGMRVCCEALGVSLSKTAPGADLGGSGKYSNESFEDRSGEKFHVNSNCGHTILLGTSSLYLVFKLSLRGCLGFAAFGCFPPLRFCNHFSVVKKRAAKTDVGETLRRKFKPTLSHETADKDEESDRDACMSDMNVSRKNEWLKEKAEQQAILTKELTDQIASLTELLKSMKGLSSSSYSAVKAPSWLDQVKEQKESEVAKTNKESAIESSVWKTATQKKRNKMGLPKDENRTADASTLCEGDWVGIPVLDGQLLSADKRVAMVSQRDGEEIYSTLCGNQMNVPIGQLAMVKHGKIEAAGMGSVMTQVRVEKMRERLTSNRNT